MILCHWTFGVEVFAVEIKGVRLKEHLHFLDLSSARSGE